MMKSMKFALSATLGLVLPLLPGTLWAGTLNFDSIDTSASPFYTNIASTNYLAQYGITLTNVTPGTTVLVECANASYNPSCSSGTGVLTAKSPPNVLTQSGVNSGESYTFVFNSPLSSLSFYTAGVNGSVGSGSSVAQWSATAYNGNTQVSQVGQPFSSYYANISPTLWILSGPGITSATFFSQCYNVCGLNLAIDDVSSPDINLQSTPLPAALPLFATGLGVMGLLARRRKRKNAAALASA